MVAKGGCAFACSLAGGGTEADHAWLAAAYSGFGCGALPAESAAHFASVGRLEVNARVVQPPENCLVAAVRQERPFAGGGLLFEAFDGQQPGLQSWGWSTLASISDTVFEESWNGWTPYLTNRGHDHELFFGNDDAFVELIDGFTAMDHYILRWRGYINIVESGDHTFQLCSDDGNLLYINEELVVDVDGLHGACHLVLAFHLA